MRAICWNGVNQVRAERVPDPRILNPHDAIVRVTMSSVCGSDLHLLHGYIPTMKRGDIIGHELIGEVVETGPAVKKLATGDRVVVCSIIACGACFYCRHDLYSVCNNTNPSHVLTDKLFGHTTAGIFGYSHAFGGYAGSHAEYVRVPFADTGAFRVPKGLPDERLVFASDALATGYMAADQAGIRPGDVVAVWGAGGVGQMAIRSAYILGAERVIAIDQHPDRLALAREKARALTVNFREVDVLDALRDLTGGRGPDRCIDAVGMEADRGGILGAIEHVKQVLHLQVDRTIVLRQAIMACRKAGTVSIAGVYAGTHDKIPMGALMNKGLEIRTGQQHGQRYIPKLVELIDRGDIDTSYLATHRLPLEDAQRGYDLFSQRKDGCLRVVFTP